jgi:hypothetical protein
LNPITACWLTLYDIPRPKPTIFANDCSFDSIKIGKGISSRKIRIENLSTEKDLIISGYSGITDKVFSTDFKPISGSNPLIIKPLEKYYFNVYFNPKEIKHYKDSIVFISNADSLDNVTYLYGVAIDSTLSDINEATTEIQNYLYAFPAYPVPSNTGFIKSLIYWDTSIDIDKEKITITNLSGEIINTDHKLSIEKNNNFSGNLIWDCRNMPPGSYFIKIEHGSASVTLKVMVD